MLCFHDKNIILITHFNIYIYICMNSKLKIKIAIINRQPILVHKVISSRIFNAYFNRWK